MIQVNLVPDVKLELVSAQRHRNVVISFAIISIIASAVVLLVLGLVIGGQVWRDNSLSNQITKKDNEFQSIEDIEKTVTIQNQLTSIQSTHEQKLMSSRIFDLLAEASAKGTDNSVTMNSFAIDTSTQTITLLAQTDKRGFEAAEVFRKNIDAMRIFYVKADADTLPNEFRATPRSSDDDEESQLIASEVNLTDLSYAQTADGNQKTVSFRLSFVYDPLLFDETVDILRIRGLDRGNVTDSYQRLPESLFDSVPQQEGAQ